jgi:hypothetical protein
VSFAQSIIGVEWAFPIKRQSAYATANPDADIEHTHPFTGADIIEHNPNMSDNMAQYGRGHEFATRQDIMSWDSMMKRTFTATTKILGWAFAFHLGSLSTTALGGSPSAYSHEMEYQDPFGSGYYGSGRQIPAFTVVERVTFPSQADSEGERLRFSSMTFDHGSVGAPADVSCDVRSIRFRTEYQMFEQDGYCPGSGYLTSGDPTSGQIRNKLEFGRRAVMLEFTVRADENTTLFTRLEAGTELEATMTFEGGLISGANRHTLMISVPKLKYRAVPIGTDGDLIVYNVQALVMYDDGIDNPFTVTVDSDETGYLVASV